MGVGYVFVNIIDTQFPEVPQVTMCPNRREISAVLCNQRVYLGGLVARYHTAPIRSAAMVQIIVLVAVLCAGVIYGQISGLIVALCAKMSATSAEVLFLRWHFRRLPWASEENRKSGRTVTSNSIQQEANDDIT